MIYTRKAHGRNMTQNKQKKLAVLVAMVITWTLSGNSRHSINVSILYFEEPPTDQNSKFNDYGLLHSVKVSKLP